jgi:peptidyl-prolyl cis-trans isomerase SurA
MKKRERRRALKYFAISLLILGLFPARSQDVSIDKIVAKVDNYIILKSDLEKAYLEFLSQGQISQGAARCDILENLVINKMLVAKAEIDSVIVDDAEVQQTLSRRMDYIISQVGSESELEEFYGKSMEQIQAELFDQIKEQMIVQRMQQEITSDIKVTPEDVRQFFDNIPRDSLPFFSTEVMVGQLVKVPEAGKKEQENVIKQLHSLRGRILKGESFGSLARQFSEDPGSAANGGELPFFKRGELAPEYEATALSLEKGQVSMPVKTDFGYHIIELLEKRGNTFKSRHILIKPTPSQADVRRTIQYLDSMRTAILNDSIEFQQAAKDYSDDQATSPNGGYFSTEDGANRVPVESLDPNVFFLIDTMQVGNISKPQSFTQQDGTTAFRILYYKERVAPHQANLRDDYQKISKAALNQKRSNILNNWFEEARGDVFIEVDPEFDYCNITE